MVTERTHKEHAVFCQKDVDKPGWWRQSNYVQPMPHTLDQPDDSNKENTNTDDADELGLNNLFDTWAASDVLNDELGNADAVGENGEDLEPDAGSHAYRLRGRFDGNDEDNEHEPISDDDAPHPNPPPPPLNNNAPNPFNLPNPHLEHLKVALDYIRYVQAAVAEELPKVIRESIDNPLMEAFKIADQDELLLFELYVACAGAPRQVYIDICKVLSNHLPDRQLCLYATITARITKWSKVELQRHDMCINGCYGYTGPLQDRITCPECGEPRYTAGTNGKSVARKQFYSIPLLSQIQAQWHTPSGSNKMQYAFCKLKRNQAASDASLDGTLDSQSDIFSGASIIDKFRAGELRRFDTMMCISMDGAQLYRSKESDTFIYTWIFLNLPPNVRYKKNHLAPAFIVPGPKKIKHPESFAYPSMHEARVLMDPGFKIQDGLTGQKEQSNLAVLAGLANGPCMTQLFGTAGHLGFHSCRFNCPVPGRLAPNGTTYYPVLLKPNDYARDLGAHPDIRPEVVSALALSPERYLEKLRSLMLSPTEAIYKKQRRETGLTKPSMMLGWPENRTLGVPGIFVSDQMHAIINAQDELIPLFTGSFTCHKDDLVASWAWCQNLMVPKNWKAHGKWIGGLRPYVPGWYEQPARNPAEKGNTQWKAIETLHYIFGVGPNVFCHRLPEAYWKHFCKLVRIFDILELDSISREEITELRQLSIEYAREFELLYVQRHAT
jgi:hypothetical protein